MIPRSIARIGLTAVTVAAVCGLAAVSAHAEPPVATLVMSGEMHYDAAAGQNNYLVISNPSAGIVQFGDVVPITFESHDGSTCWYPYASSTMTVRCDHSATFLD